MISRVFSSPVRATIGVAILSVGAIFLAGCSSSEIPPEEKEAINLGANERVGSVEVGNLLLVSRGEGQPARLIGVLLNELESSVDVAFADADDETTINLGPGQQYAFQENVTVFETADGIPGSFVDVTVTVAGESDTMVVPVRDGSLGWLAPYLPQQR